eukprot:snap_masked-scaffold_4-processed-gene-4.31-mRNA-1 protein AED:1.00 eAED:1.00 QI:0/-1/0/0/-1/1/1/0/96
MLIIFGVTEWILRALINLLSANSSMLNQQPICSLALLIEWHVSLNAIVLLEEWVFSTALGEYTPETGKNLGGSNGGKRFGKTPFPQKLITMIISLG